MSERPYDNRVGNTRTSPITSSDEIWKEISNVVYCSNEQVPGEAPKHINVEFILDYGTERITHTVQINQDFNFGTVKLIAGVWNGAAKIDIDTNGETNLPRKFYYKNENGDIIESLKTTKKLIATKVLNKKSNLLPENEMTLERRNRIARKFIITANRQLNL